MKSHKLKSIAFLTAVILSLIILGTKKSRIDDFQDKSVYVSKIEEKYTITDAYEAISKNNLSLLKDILASGVGLEETDIIEEKNINTGDVWYNKSFTLLGLAVFYNRPEIADWLIENGADVTAAQPMGTILSWAITYHMEDIAIKIINRGGGYPVKEYNPASHAKLQKMEKIVQLLERYGVYSDVVPPQAGTVAMPPKYKKRGKNEKKN